MDTVIRELRSSLSGPDDQKLNDESMRQSHLNQTYNSGDDLESAGLLRNSDSLSQFSRKREAPEDDGRNDVHTLAPDAKRARLSLSGQSSHSQASASTKTWPVKQRRQQARRRKVLPLGFTRGGTRLSYRACPDSGSSHNIISLSTAKEIGCPIESTDGESWSSFVLANGKQVEAIGRVITDCCFETGTPWRGPEALQCLFHVFNNLSVPLIMGIDFLERTEIYSKYMDRLIEEPILTNPPIQVNAVGASPRRLVCKLNEYAALATIDTGADLDLVSASYARSRAFNIQEDVQFVEFADGSVGATSGIIQVSFTIGQIDMERRCFVGTSETIEIDFYVLPGLMCDILVGQYTIEELNVFQTQMDSIISSDPTANQSSAIIRLISEKENAGLKLWNRLCGSVNRISVRPSIFGGDN